MDQDDGRRSRRVSRGSIRDLAPGQFDEEAGDPMSVGSL